ncbi:MAG: DUF2283 domain-containing protein [Desulfobacteraceae bacterium]|nr:DUF2283 domain-containing protein [Pseudomonadota bacterium]MCG2757900.1 DUF2283 domain-containing protein [Desulfobacteraceae bacterium]
MKIRYSTDADVCIIELKPGIPEDSIDLKEGVILHLDKDGKPIEIEIINASKFVSLDEITFSLPKVKLPKAIQYASARHS